MNEKKLNEIIEITISKIKSMKDKHAQKKVYNNLGGKKPIRTSYKNGIFSKTNQYNFHEVDYYPSKLYIPLEGFDINNEKYDIRILPKELNSDWKKITKSRKDEFYDQRRSLCKILNHKKIDIEYNLDKKFYHPTIESYEKINEYLNLI